MEQRVLAIERVIAMTRLVLRLLCTGMILHAGMACQDVLEKRVGNQLKEAMHEDLLIPNTFVGTLYDVDCMERMLEQIIATNTLAFSASLEI
uniref:NPH3 domain-containing protein n=1 Tax=Oryza rufipogon TaxID=4529 RepID=A0A0E0PV84_ORYRU